MTALAIALAAAIGFAVGLILARRRTPNPTKDIAMPSTTIRAKRGDTTFVPLVQFADYEAGTRANLTGRDIVATATLGTATTPVFVEVVDAAEGEVILELAPKRIGDWIVDVAGLDASFTVRVVEDVTNG